MDDTDPTAAPNRRGPAAPAGRPVRRGPSASSTVATRAPLPPPPPPAPPADVDPAHPDPDGELARLLRRAGRAADAAASAGAAVVPPLAVRPTDERAPEPTEVGDDAPLPEPPDRSVLDGRRLGACVAVLVAVAVLCSQLLNLMGAGRPVISIVDNFPGDSASGLGETESGQAWDSPLGGTWAKDNSAAYMAEQNPKGPRTVAVVDLGSSHGSVQATIAHLAEGWGLVFRYTGPSNYWMVTASPQFSAYNIARVEDGKHVPIDSARLARVREGATVVVRFQGPVVEIAVDDKIVKRVSVPTGFGPMGTKVGLIGTQAATDARWSGFAAEQLPADGAAPAPSTTLRVGR